MQIKGGNRKEERESKYSKEENSYVGVFFMERKDSKMKKYYIKLFEQYVGKLIKDTFYLECVSLQRSNEEDYLEVVLQDKTGRIKAILGDLTEQDSLTYYQNIPVVVSGVVLQGLDGKITWNIIDIKKAETWNEEDLFNGLNKEQINEYKIKLYEAIKVVKHENYNALLSGVFEEWMEKFSITPADYEENKFYAYNGGLIVYSYTLAKTVSHTQNILEKNNIKPFYCHYYDKNLLITASLLHGIGVIKEIEPFPNFRRKTISDYLSTGENTLECLTEIMLKKKIFLSEEEKGRLFHAILATWDDRITPRCMEEMLLSYTRKILLKYGEY